VFNLPVFLGFLVAFIVAIMLTSSAVPPGDPFGANANSRNPVSLDAYPMPVFAELKSEHAKARPQVDIGLFGNSRSLDVGLQHLSSKACSFFNYSIPGESIRGSISYLERLAADDAAPVTAVISLDNFEIQFYGNPEAEPFLPRVTRALKDVFHGLTQPDVRSVNALRMAWRHLRTEGLLFRNKFKPLYFSAGLRSLHAWATGAVVYAESLTSGYRRDGSRRTPALTSHAASPAGAPLSKSLQIFPGYFAYDLKRLKKIENGGVRVIVYETAIAPAAADIFMSKASPQAKRSRDEFVKTCRELGLSCRVAPKRLPGGERPWSDRTHAPAENLGANLDGLIAAYKVGCAA
jgi:hypothetical protein